MTHFELTEAARALDEVPGAHCVPLEAVVVAGAGHELLDSLDDDGLAAAARFVTVT